MSACKHCGLGDYSCSWDGCPGNTPPGAEAGKVEPMTLEKWRHASKGETWGVDTGELHNLIDCAIDEIDAKDAEIERLKDRFENAVCDNPVCEAVVLRKDDGSRVCSAGHPSRWVPVTVLRSVETERDTAIRERDEARKDTDRMCKALDTRSIELHTLREAVGPLVEAAEKYSNSRELGEAIRAYRAAVGEGKDA
jgi:hypothetical protein